MDNVGELNISNTEIFWYEYTYCDEDDCLMRECCRGSNKYSFEMIFICLCSLAKFSSSFVTMVTGVEFLSNRGRNGTMPRSSNIG